jgi:hypothetical protein
LADIYDVEIDLDLLNRNLKASDEASTVDEILQDLKATGFYGQESGLCRSEEICLQCLVAARFLRKRSR